MVKLLNGPDFSDNVIFSFNASDLSIYIPIPSACVEKTKSCDCNIGDLASSATYDVPSEKWMSRKRLLRSAFHYDRASSGLDLGLTSVMIQICQVSKGYTDTWSSLLNEDAFTAALIASPNDLKEKLISENYNRDFFQFPDSSTEVENFESGNLLWKYMHAGYVELNSPDIYFATPISANNILLIEANIGAYNFKLPDGQREAMILEAEADLFEFIKSIRIDFSPEIQAQIDEARAIENA